MIMVAQVPTMCVKLAAVRYSDSAELNDPSDFVVISSNDRELTPISHSRISQDIQYYYLQGST